VRLAARVKRLQRAHDHDQNDAEREWPQRPYSGHWLRMLKIFLRYFARTGQAEAAARAEEAIAFLGEYVARGRSGAHVEGCCHGFLLKYQRTRDCAFVGQPDTSGGREMPLEMSMAGQLRWCDRIDGWGAKA